MALQRKVVQAASRQFKKATQTEESVDAGRNTVEHAALVAGL
jgi:hypothetical protein